MQPEDGGRNLIGTAVIALAMFLLPLLQRWLRRRVERADEEGPAPDLFPVPEPWREEEIVEEPKPVPPPSPQARAPVNVTPLVSPVEAPPRPAVRRLEERVFANRRWSPGAKLLIAKAILERPRGLRRRP
jgi:hypothetical protein